MYLFQNKPIGFFSVNADANVVAYSSNEVVYWQSGTGQGSSANRSMALADDGRLVVYDNDNTEIWSSGQLREIILQLPKVIYIAIDFVCF